MQPHKLPLLVEYKSLLLIQVAHLPARFLLIPTRVLVQSFVEDTMSPNYHTYWGCRMKCQLPRLSKDRLQHIVQPMSDSNQDYSARVPLSGNSVGLYWKAFSRICSMPLQTLQHVIRSRL